MNSRYITAAEIEASVEKVRTEIHRRQATELLRAIEARDISVRYCAGCGEPEGSPYAKHCCTDDNMLEG